MRFGVPSMKVKVYYNLRKKTFSIQHKGIVIDHKDQVLLQNVIFKVNESGRQRVLKEKRKNVHAFVIGDLSAYAEPKVKTKDVIYNPYITSSFVFGDTMIPVSKAKTAWLSHKTIKIDE